MESTPPELQNLAWLKGDWCFPSTTKETDSLLRQCLDVPPMSTAVPEQIVEEVAANSERFPIPFPVENVRLRKLKQLRPDADLRGHIASTYPLIHERVLLLVASFIMYKREFGSPIEKALYKDMSIPQFVDRLLLKRSVTFCGARDTYQLLTGETGQDGWEQIGTVNQKPPLVLETCLSYDEMRIAAMLFVSGHTEFINDGERRNLAKLQQEGIERDGVIIGLIGTRLQRKFRMEYEELLITEQQNSLSNGYGEEITSRTCLDVLMTSYVRNNLSGKFMWRQMWSEFYQVPSYTYAELAPLQHPPSGSRLYTERFVLRPRSSDIFDNEVYYKRLSIAFDCALLDADSRAAAVNKMAYLNVVGIGLGVWMVSGHQTDVFVLTFLERLKACLARGLLQRVADVNFAYIKPSDDIVDILKKYPLFESSTHPNGGVRIHCLMRQPSSALTGESEGELLVATYAWDGNAHPGNEFWMGNLDTSGDPAAACSTQVAELHNAHVNTRYLRAGNLRVAGSHGLLTLHEYCTILLSDSTDLEHSSDAIKKILNSRDDLLCVQEGNGYRPL